MPIDVAFIGTVGPIVVSLAGLALTQKEVFEKKPLDPKRFETSLTRITSQTTTAKAQPK